MNLNIPENEKTPLVKQLLKIINELSQEIISLKKEILKLKKETIRSNKLNAPEREDTEEDGRKAKRKSRKGIKKMSATEMPTLK